MPAIYLPKSKNGLVIYVFIFAACFAFIDAELLSVGYGLVAAICTIVIILVFVMAWKRRERGIAVTKDLQDKGIIKNK